METLLSSIAELVKGSYTADPQTSVVSTAANAVGSKRNALEIKMLFGGSFPDAFKPVIVELYKPDTGLLAKLDADVEPAYLFFADFTMLEVHDDKKEVTKRKKMGKTMDCFRKTWVNNPVRVIERLGADGTAGQRQTRWRRCARCASVMEEVVVPGRGMNWFMVQQRRCFCSGYWNSLAVGEKVA